MDFKEPHKSEIAEQRFPVRLTAFVGGTVHDWQNDQTRRWPHRHLGDDGYCVMPAESMSGRMAVHILLPLVYDAATLLLTCPHLRLHKHIYNAPEPVGGPSHLAQAPLGRTLLPSLHQDPGASGQARRKSKRGAAVGRQGGRARELCPLARRKLHGDATAFHFRTLEDPARFCAAFPMFALADGTNHELA